MTIYYIIIFLYRINQNKLLFNDFTTLQIAIENKNSELIKLKSQIINYIEANQRLNKEKTELEINLNSLREIKVHNKVKIDNLIQENEQISQRCLLQEDNIKKLEHEKERLLNLNKELDEENRIVHAKLKSKEKDFIESSNKLGETTKEYQNAEQQYNQLNSNNELIKKQIDEISQSSKNEIRKRLEKDRELDNIEKRVRDKEDELNKLKNEIENLKSIKEKVFEDNVNLYNSLGKLRQHIIVLSEQNAKVSLLNKHI